MASRMRSAVESYAKAHNISNEQATRELASRSTNASLGLYGDAYAKGHLGISVLGNGGGLVSRPELRQALMAVILTHMKPVVVHGPAMMLVMISMPELHKTLKKPAITLPAAKSVNPAAILTIMLIPVWISCLQP